MNILVCTLGASWAVIPEIFGFVAPGHLDLYACHPGRARLAALRAEHALQPPDEIWLCTTGGRQTAEALGKVRAWWSLIGAPLPLRVWIAQGSDQLASEDECRHLRELGFRVVLHAAQRCGAEGQLLLSLAGGRKTMSADLQAAGQAFGAHACLHVVGPDPLPDAIARQASPARFALPLPPKLAGAVTPLVAGRGYRSELLDIEIDGITIDGAHFPLPLAPAQMVGAEASMADAVAWPRPLVGERWLTTELDRRERESGRLLGNFLATLAEREHHENWRSLYRLPPRIIDHLQRTKVGEADLPLLARLPKADLHRHIGGCLGLDAQIAVGHAVWDDSPAASRAQALAAVAELIAAAERREDWPADWPARHLSKQLPPEERARRCAALLVHCPPSALEHVLYRACGPRIALKSRSPLGFSAYERPGELTGSAILTHLAALAPYARALVAQAHTEGLAYVELRGSPHKYRPAAPARFVAELRDELARAGARVGAADTSASGHGAQAPRFALTWILDRRQRERLGDIVAHAVSARAEHPDFLVGLDLAGDEGTQAPEALRAHFLPAFRECLRITIHAGEGERAENIWQAAYHLHADRIGHGLSLADNPRLRDRFRDRDICIELCPTSNIEVVGYHDPNRPDTEGLPKYPIRSFLEHGVPVSICTDNPGISRTTLGDEILTAARIGGGLSLWETLALIKQGITHAFVSAAEREALLKRADGLIYTLFATPL